MNHKAFKAYVITKRQASTMKATKAQVNAVVAIFYKTSRDERLRILSELTGRQIGSGNDLWFGEADAIISEYLGHKDEFKDMIDAIKNTHPG